LVVINLENMINYLNFYAVLIKKKGVCISKKDLKVYIGQTGHANTYEFKDDTVYDSGKYV